MIGLKNNSDTVPVAPPLEISLEGVKAMVAIPVNRDFPWQTTQALVETVGDLAARGINYLVQFLTNGSQIDHSRSMLAHYFLKSDCTHLFWIDSDMAWRSESFIRLLALATKMPIVAATYPAKRGPTTEFQLDLADVKVTANEYGCLPVNGLGLGFAVIQRKVIETLAAKARKFMEGKEMVAAIFRCGLDDDDVLRSEDMHFYKACRDNGFPVMVDPTIVLGHVGGKEYRGKLMDALMRQNTLPPLMGELLRDSTITSCDRGAINLRSEAQGLPLVS